MFHGRPLMLGISVLASACGGFTYDGYVLHEALATSPKPPGCNFRVASTVPTSGYEEVATLTLKNGINGNVPRDPETFAQDARGQVCKAGGDIVVTEVNGRGDIVRGIVFRQQVVAR